MTTLYQKWLMFGRFILFSLQWLVVWYYQTQNSSIRKIASNLLWWDLRHKCIRLYSCENIYPASTEMVILTQAIYRQKIWWSIAYIRAWHLEHQAIIWTNVDSRLLALIPVYFQRKCPKHGGEYCRLNFFRDSHVPARAQWVHRDNKYAIPSV